MGCRKLQIQDLFSFVELEENRSFNFVQPTEKSHSQEQKRGQVHCHLKDAFSMVDNQPVPKTIPAENKSITTDILGNSVVLKSNLFREMKEASYNGLVSLAKYDENSNLIKSAMGDSLSSANTNLANAVTSTKNIIGQTTAITVPDLDNAVTKIAPSGCGVAGAVEDPKGTVNKTELTESGSVKQVNQASGTSDSRDTDSNTKLTASATTNTKTVFRSGQGTKWITNKVGQLLKTEYYYYATNIDNLGSLSEDESFEYDEYGRLEKHTKRDDSEETYYYYSMSDATKQRGKLKEIKEEGNLVKKISEYSAIGQPSVITKYTTPGSTSEYITTTLTYHTSGVNFGMLESEKTEIVATGIATNTSTVGFTYDAAGKRKGFTYPEISPGTPGPELAYTYANEKFLNGITENSSPLLNITLDPDFKVPTNRNLNNSLDVAYEYKSKTLGLISDIKVGTGTDYVATFDYEKRGLKSRTGQWVNSETTYSRTYLNDPLYRITNSTAKTGDKFANEYFKLDEFENRVFAVIDGIPIDYAIGTGNQYTSITSPGTIYTIAGAANPGIITNIPQTVIKVNFQSNTDYALPGYSTECGELYDSADSPTYGFTSIYPPLAFPVGFDPNSLPAPDPVENYEFNTNIDFVPWTMISGALGTSWQMDLDNGTYAVRIVTGSNSSETSKRYRLFLNQASAPFMDKTVSPDNYADVTSIVEVTDGKLSVTVPPNPDGLIPGVTYDFFDTVPLAFIHITEVPAVKVQKVNFQSLHGYNGAPGYVTEDGNEYNPENSPTFGFEYDLSFPNINPPLEPINQYEYSTNIVFTPGNELWTIDLENNEYNVRIVTAIFPLMTARYQIAVNGNMDNLFMDTEVSSGESNAWADVSRIVNVTNGKMTIQVPTSAPHNVPICFIHISEVESSSSSVISFSPKYDARGNLIEDYRFKYQWTYDNLLKEAEDRFYDEGNTDSAYPKKVNYTHDAMGRRALVRYTGQGVSFTNKWKNYRIIYDGVVPVQEEYLDGSGIKARYYYESINRLIKAEIDHDNNNATPLVTYLPIIDDRGTLMGVADANGVLIEKLYNDSTGLMKSYTFDAAVDNGDGTFEGWAETLNASNKNICRSKYLPFGWTGMRKDRFTGLYHTHFREYDPIHGRWLSEDPAGYRDGLNLYGAYMGVDGTDALGLGLLDELQTTAKNPFAVGWAGVKGYYGAGWNLAKFAGNTLYQGLVLNPLDVINMSVETASLGKVQMWGDLGTSTQAITSKQVSTGNYYYDLTGNVLTVGMYGQGKASIEYAYGLKTQEEWSAQFGGTGLIQLGSAGLMKTAQGRTPTFDKWANTGFNKLGPKTQNFLRYLTKDVKDVKVDLQNLIRPGPKTSFYVSPNGEVIPAVGYRYMDSKYAYLTINSKEAPLSYFGFSKFKSASGARNAYQIFWEKGNAASWSNARLLGEFDTLQLFSKDGVPLVKVPYEAGGTGILFEPITRFYPEYGTGGYPQLVPKNPMNVKLNNASLISE